MASTTASNLLWAFKLHAHTRSESMSFHALRRLGLRFFHQECPKKFLIFCSYLAENSKIWGNLGERNLFVNIFFFQMPMFLNFLPIISIKLKFMQCAIMAFFKARLWWCFVILWRLFKSYWTIFKQNLFRLLSLVYLRYPMFVWNT